MNKSRKNDQFMYALLAVVFAAAAVIYLKSFGVMPQVLGGQTSNRGILGAETPSVMMDQLQKTVDDGGMADTARLKSEAAGW